MAMFRRSRKPAPPLHRKQKEIAQQEAQLREKRETPGAHRHPIAGACAEQIFSARAGPQGLQQCCRKAISRLNRNGRPAGV